MQDVHFFADHLRKSVQPRVTQAETRKKCRRTGGRTTEKEKNMKIAALPLILMSLLFILVPSLIGSTSFMIVPSGAIAIGVAYLMFRKKNMQSPEQTKADPDRANTGHE